MLTSVDISATKYTDILGFFLFLHILFIILVHLFNCLSDSAQQPKCFQLNAIISMVMCEHLHATLTRKTFLIPKGIKCNIFSIIIQVRDG